LVLTSGIELDSIPTYKYFQKTLLFPLQRNEQGAMNWIRYFELVLRTLTLKKLITGALKSEPAGNAQLKVKANVAC
jgi:hypothetical protein